MTTGVISKMVILDLNQGTLVNLTLTEKAANERDIATYWKVTVDEPIPGFKPFHIGVSSTNYLCLKGVNSKTTKMPDDLIAHAIHMLAHDLSFKNTNHRPTFMVSKSYQRLIGILKDAGFVEDSSYCNKSKFRFVYNPTAYC